VADSCSSFEDLLFEPEEDLSQKNVLRLAAHIEACGPCRAERELFLESWSALDEFEPELEPSPLIRARVWEKIREEEQLPPPLIEPETAESLTGVLQKLTVAGIALLLGFGLGRGLAPSPPASPTSGSPSLVSSTSEESLDEFLDPALLELASQEGFSVEIFPESTEFTPLDQEMRTALATSDEERVWVQQDRGVVVPVQYISQDQGGLTR
jgi:hypothetical protein